ncbi:L,D-transpeptidase [Nocardia stercoris]|uniref:L,D-TPase catalytic domain-containing protein n=1 Tax=Nocardia stercoris TaxID=2483361 RepID=A0A3M2LHS5_9NOCA|nr:Ig-like domain-containing protein [Nocardia stercoris]RMI35555.1 hypothetical protein EBN03_04760 [Nocardia stercoris]
MSGRRHRLGVALVSVVLAVTMAACSSSKAPSHPAPVAAKPGPTITVTPGDGNTDVDPLGKIQVSTSDGILTDVSLTNEQGKSVDGILTPDKTVWKPTAPLGYGHTYTVKASGLSLTGTTGPSTTTFTTITPRNQTKAYLTLTSTSLIADGGTYGVGTVVVAHFDEPIADKAAAERRLAVTSDPPQGGSWYWVDDRNAHFRPEKYWAPGTKITAAANIFGAEVGPGMYGQEDSKVSFQIGNAHVAIADDNTHQVEVYDNGQLVRTMPTSMGRGGTEVIAGKTFSFWTMPGTYTVMDKGNPVIMDSSSYGLPVNSRLGYKEAIPWATRISNDGIYLHELDSTVGAQGSYNTSHGCLNLNQDNASWFYNWSIPGDVVEVHNTGGPPLQVWDNGDWTLSWDDWKQGSALSS